jgi:hypothetical protein
MSSSRAGRLVVVDGHWPRLASTTQGGAAAGSLGA